MSDLIPVESFDEETFINEDESALEHLNPFDFDNEDDSFLENLDPFLFDDEDESFMQDLAQDLFLFRSSNQKRFDQEQIKTAWLWY